MQLVARIAREYRVRHADPAGLEALCAALGEAYPAFDRAAFMARIHTAEWDDLALKAKMRHTTEALADREPAAANPMAVRNNRIEIVLLRSDTR